MNIESWLLEIEEFLKTKGIKFTDKIKSHLLSEFPENSTFEQKKITTEILEAVYFLFFFKASRGDTFGPLDKIEKRFGETLEENYGVFSGPFLNMAKTYWTYKIEIGDLYPTHRKLILSRILKEVEITVASVFFPTPGPYEIPVQERTKKQRELLKIFASEIDIDRFISENPILKK